MLDLIVANEDKSILPDLLTMEGIRAPSDPREDTSISKTGGWRFRNENAFTYGNVVPDGHTRAYIKIQDGCDRMCTYCKVPFTRGRGISRDMAEIIDHALYLEERGVPEIVLTGVNIGWYKDSTGKKAIHTLIRTLLDRLSTTRLRLSSIEPGDVKEELLEMSLHPNFCNFFHIPLQSGSDPILEKMRRRYTRHEFLNTLQQIRRINPHAMIGSDVMVGFPGESERDFLDSWNVVRDGGISNLHVFRYSPRKGTEAARMNGRIHGDELHRRMNLLMELETENWNEFARSQMGRSLDAVVERNMEEDFQEALTDNYLKILFPVDPGKRIRPGSMHRLRLQKIGNDKRIHGTLLDSPVAGMISNP